MEKNFRYKTLLLIIVFTGFFTVTEFNSGMELKYIFQDVKQEDMNVNIVFVGFDEYYTLEENYDAFLSGDVNTFEALNYYYPANNFPHSVYNVNYTFSSLSTAEENALSTYVENNVIYYSNFNYRINTTAVDEYIVTEEYEDFDDFLLLTNGSLIDAKLIENYISEKLYSISEDDFGYTLYMMNFSNLDDEALNQDHAYSYTLPDSDAMSVVPDHITQDIQRTTIGWGGEQRFCFVDISAISYFMFYYALMFELEMSLAPAYTFYDIDSYARTLDLQTPEGLFDMRLYISQWIDSYTRNVFLSSAVYFPPIDVNIKLPVAVFSNISDQGYPLDTVSWAISSDRIKSFLGDGFPWINWDVPLDFYDLQDYPEIYNHLAQNIQEDEAGYFIDVEAVAEIMDEKLDEFFDMTFEGTQSLSLVFLNHYVRFKYGDINLGGIALGDYQITIRNPNQLFYESNVNQPRGGLTRTMVHEIGHNLGLSHPHNSMYWGSMFIEDVMSYQFSSTNFSTFSSDTIARFHFDYYYLNAQGNLSSLENVNLRGFTTVTDLLEESYSDYLKMDYIPAIEKAIEAHEMSLELSNALRKPAILSVVVVSSAVVAVTIPVLFIRFNPLAKLRG